MTSFPSEPKHRASHNPVLNTVPLHELSLQAINPFRHNKRPAPYPSKIATPGRLSPVVHSPLPPSASNQRLLCLPVRDQRMSVPGLGGGVSIQNVKYLVNRTNQTAD